MSAIELYPLPVLEALAEYPVEGEADDNLDVKDLLAAGEAAFLIGLEGRKT